MSSATHHDDDPRARQLARAKARWEQGNAFLLDLVCDELIDRLALVSRTFDHAVSLFDWTGGLTERLHQSKQATEVTRIDAAVHLDTCDRIAAPDALGLEPDSADLIVAPIALHWANDLPGALMQIARALRPDGLFLGALPGPAALADLRAALLQAESEATGGAALRVDPFTSVQDAGALLQRAGLALPVIDTQAHTVRYGDVWGLIADLRRFGVTVPMAGIDRAVPMAAGRALAATYQEIAGDPDGRVRAGFEFIYLSGWKPHASQQKPLKPGSATISLTEVLGKEG